MCVCVATLSGRIRIHVMRTLIFSVPIEHVTYFIYRSTAARTREKKKKKKKKKAIYKTDNIFFYKIIFNKIATQLNLKSIIFKLEIALQGSLFEN